MVIEIVGDGAIWKLNLGDGKLKLEVSIS